MSRHSLIGAFKLIQGENNNIINENEDEDEIQPPINLLGRNKHSILKKNNLLNLKELPKVESESDNTNSSDESKTYDYSKILENNPSTQLKKQKSVTINDPLQWDDIKISNSLHNENIQKQTEKSSMKSSFKKSDIDLSRFSFNPNVNFKKIQVKQNADRNEEDSLNNSENSLSQIDSQQELEELFKNKQISLPKIEITTPFQMPRIQITKADSPLKEQLQIQMTVEEAGDVIKKQLLKFLIKKKEQKEKSNNQANNNTIQLNSSEEFKQFPVDIQNESQSIFRQRRLQIQQKQLLEKQNQIHDLDKLSSEFLVPQQQPKKISFLSSQDDFLFQQVQGLPSSQNNDSSDLDDSLSYKKFNYDYEIDNKANNKQIVRFQKEQSHFSNKSQIIFQRDSIDDNNNEFIQQKQQQELISNKSLELVKNKVNEGRLSETIANYGQIQNEKNLPQNLKQLQKGEISNQQNKFNNSEKEIQNFNDFKPTENLAKIFENYKFSEEEKQIDSTLFLEKEKTTKNKLKEKQKITNHSISQDQEEEYIFEMINSNLNVITNQIKQTDSKKAGIQLQHQQERLAEFAFYENEKTTMLYLFFIQFKSQQNVLPFIEFSEETINLKINEKEVELVQSVLFQENYQEYVNLNSLPKISRNQLLCRKVEGIMSTALYKNRQNQLKSQVSIDPILKETNEFNQEISKIKISESIIQSFQQKQFPTQLNLIPMKKNQKTIQILLRTSTVYDQKILYQNEWYSFDISIEIKKKEEKKKSVSKSPAKQTKRSISPFAPKSIVRQVYQECGLSKKEENVLDWYLAYNDNKLIIEPNQFKLKKSKKLSENNKICFYLIFEVTHIVQYSKTKFSELLMLIGSLINEEIISRFELNEHKNSTQDTMSFDYQIPRYNIQSGFDVKYIMTIDVVSQVILTFLYFSESLWSFKQINSSLIFSQLKSTPFLLAPINSKHFSPLYKKKSQESDFLADSASEQIIQPKEKPRKSLQFKIQLTNNITDYQFSD